MKRFMFRFIVLATGLTLGLVAYMLIIGEPGSFVTVTLKNNSSKEIESVRIVHEEGVELVEHIAPGSSKQGRFYATGETSYSLFVRFADGSSVKGGGGYVESGYSMTEHISSAEIMSDFDLGY